MKPIRIGKISFTNVLPLYHYFEGKDLPIDLIPATPTQLNRQMAANKIDMAPISSFAYADRFPNYVLLPNLSISATGSVGSIFLFTRGKELHELRNSRIALSNTSASSVALFRILIEHFEKGKPEYVTLSPDLNQMMDISDAALLIGDDAIKAKWANGPYRVLDLGTEWYKRTQLSMTFALWAVRREIAETRKEELESIYSRFIKAKHQCFQYLMPVIQKAQKQLGSGSDTFWEQYFQNLNYDFHQEQMQGLAVYYDLAAKLGMISPEVEIQMLDLPIGINRVSK